MLGVRTKKKSQLSHFDSPSALYRKQRFQRPFVAAAFVVIVASLAELPSLTVETDRYAIDSELVASRTVRALFSVPAEDLAATREKREEAAAKVPITYSVDLERVKNQLLTLNQRINTLTERSAEVDKAVREALLASNSQDPHEEAITRAVAQLSIKWKEDPLFEGYPDASALAVWLQPRLDTVPQREFEETATGADVQVQPSAVRHLSEPASPFQYAHLDALTQLTRDGLEYVLSSGVIQPGNLPVSDDNPEPRIQILRGRVVGGLVSDLALSEEGPVTIAVDSNQARLRLRARIAETAQKMAALSGADPQVDWEQVQNAAFEMAQSSITDTLTPNQVVTEGNRQLARNSVEPVMKTIDANQIIQQEGYKWTQQSRSDAETYWNHLQTGQKPSRNFFSPITACALFTALMLLGLLRAMPVLATKGLDVYKAVNVTLLVVCSTLVLGRIVSYFEQSGFLVPVMTGSILLTILTNARLASFATVVMALLLSIQFGYSWNVLIVSCAMGLAGISSLYIVRKRGDIARACIYGTGIGIAAICAISLASEPMTIPATINYAAMITLNGLVCMFVVPGLLSPLERLFGITTDIQLLEYSDLNNPLLRRLAIEIPATYAHSLMMGQLAEAAADAIGANGLLARVCAYYHDIGKMRRPEYFSENQTGHNIHEDLSPRLSARAIASHVTEGIEIAREFHLPQPIIDGILEHHGTSLISFFYQQAVDQQKHGDVRETDYRYPGPKPQSRETAILMICDGVESGVRSIKNANEERIREFVDKIITARSEDRQFDECDLTLKDLDVIGEVIARRIMTTHHTRIAYPDKPASKPARNVIPMSGGRDL